MNNRVLDFFKPSSLSERKAFGVSVALMLIIFFFDIATAIEIRLGVLYVLPIALVGLHCKKRIFQYTAIFLSVLFQTINAVQGDVPPAPFITDIAVGFISACLVALLAGAVRKNHAAVQTLSQTDVLTNLMNRRGFELKLEAELDRQKRYGGTFSLVLIDLDKFKELNDSRGHAEGDSALRVVGEILDGTTRDSDTCTRLGGDEFAVLLPNTKKGECDFVCSQLVSNVQNRMVQAHFTITASIGAVTFDYPPDSMAAAIHIVDRAMYKAKADGRNTVVSI